MNCVRALVFGCGLLAMGCGVATDVRAYSDKDKQWPCAQRKRLDLSLGAMWTGPEASETDKTWQNDPSRVELVKQLAKRRLPVEDAKKLIDESVATMSGDKSEQLTLLFNGLFQTLNLERRNIVVGIDKYAQKQFDLSEKVKKIALEVDALGSKEELTDDDVKKLDALNEKLVWDTRIYDERNQSLEYVCESPVLIEQRLFALAKHIEAQLKGSGG